MAPTLTDRENELLVSIFKSLKAPLDVSIYALLLFVPSTLTTSVVWWFMIPLASFLLFTTSFPPNTSNEVLTLLITHEIVLNCLPGRPRQVCRHQRLQDSCFR